MRITALTLAVSLLLPLSVRADEGITICPAMTSGSGLKENEKHFTKLINGKNGWVFSSDYLKPLRPLSPEMIEYFTRLNKALQARGTQLVLANVPFTTMLYPEYLATAQDEAASKLTASYTALIGQIKSTGILAPDLYSAMRAGKDEGEVFFRRDTHWTPLGAKIAAGAVAKSIKASDAFGKVAKASFTTSLKKTIDYKGQYGDALSRICKADTPVQKLEIYETTGGSAGSDLQGAGAAVDIILTGTSMSAAGQPFFNFSGALQEQLSADVLNLSVGGGRSDTALISYLNGESFAKAPPKFLIWETPVYYSLNAPALLRQLIPAVKGTCSNPLATQEGKLANGSKIFASSVSSKAKDYLSLEFDDLALLEFDLILTYANSDETVSLKRSSRAPNSGHFYLELSQPDLRSVSLKAKDKASGTVKISLCSG
jgi:alginate biosynthesis protein AlgX